jgi:hypothetical protein
MTISKTSITADDIRALRTEAETAGDEDMASICSVALSVDEHGDGENDHAAFTGHLGINTRTEAIAYCTRVIDDARAMAD